MFAKSLLAMVAVVGLVFAGADDDTAKKTDKQDKLAGVKCVVNGTGAAKDETAVKYKDGEVYFCCNGCAAKFKADPSKYEVKANHQLAATGQYVQQGCPMSGGKLTEGVTAEVGTVKVGFCCPGCASKVNDAADLEAKANIVFAKASFEKAFTKAEEEVDLSKVKCPMMPKKTVKAEQAVDYMGGKVYFCCKMCAGKFAKDKDNEKFAPKVNHQLVLTGQFVQKGCPMSGGEVDDEQMVKVGGVEVKFCCGNCKGKAEAALKENEDDAVKMIFAKEAFKKGFEKKAEKVDSKG